MAQLSDHFYPMGMFYSWPCLAVGAWSFILLSLICLGGVEHAEGIFSAKIGKVTFPDQVQDPKFRVRFLSEKSAMNRREKLVAAHPDQTVLMTDKKGKKFICLLPDSYHGGGIGKAAGDPTPGNVTEDNSTPSKSEQSGSDDFKSSAKSAEDLLSALRGQCFHVVIDYWWTYEYCFKKSLRQYHRENNKITQEFHLGRYDKEATAALQASSPEVFVQKDLQSHSSESRYHVHMMTNGTPCDLTAKPRQTEVRFFCSDSATGVALAISDSNFAIEEPSTCSYVWTIHSPHLCKNSSFQQKKKPLNTIECFPVGEGGNLEPVVSKS